MFNPLIKTLCFMPEHIFYMVGLISLFLLYRSINRPALSTDGDLMRLMPVHCILKLTSAPLSLSVSLSLSLSVSLSLPPPPLSLSLSLSCFQLYLSCSNHVLTYHLNVLQQVDASLFESVLLLSGLCVIYTFVQGLPE